MGRRVDPATRLRTEPGTALPAAIPLCGIPRGSGMSLAEQQAEQQIESRAVPRVPINLWGEVRSSAGVCNCEVVDLSRDGAKIRSERAWEVGEEVRLTMELFGTCRGSVVWCDSGTVGIEFAEEFVMLTLLIGGWCSFGG